jgi:hypothetical protein
MKVIGLAGWSGAGKTTLLTRVIPQLVAPTSTALAGKIVRFELFHDGVDLYDSCVRARRWLPDGHLHLACAASLGAAAGGGAAGLAASSPHWARARAPQPFAAALAGAGAPAAERGAFAARAALQIMAAAEPGGAVDAAGDAKALLDAAETPAGDVYTSFASLFAQALAQGSPALAATLAREYGPALERTDDLPALAERACGAAFVAAGGGPPGLGELLRAMGGGG